jgi:hypothetical protein
MITVHVPFALNLAQGQARSRRGESIPKPKADQSRQLRRISGAGWGWRSAVVSDCRGPVRKWRRFPYEFF